MNGGERVDATTPQREETDDERHTRLTRVFDAWKACEDQSISVPQAEVIYEMPRAKNTESERLIRCAICNPSGGRAELKIVKRYRANLAATLNEHIVSAALAELVRAGRTYPKTGRLDSNPDIKVAGPTLDSVEQSFGGIDLEDLFFFIGRSDKPHLKNDPMFLLRLWRSVLIALKSIHDLDWVHCDVKPDNFCAKIVGWSRDTNDHHATLLVDMEDIVVVDFGMTFLSSVARAETDGLQMNRVKQGDWLHGKCNGQRFAYIPGNEGRLHPKYVAFFKKYAGRHVVRQDGPFGTALGDGVNADHIATIDFAQEVDYYGLAHCVNEFNKNVSTTRFDDGEKYVVEKASKCLLWLSEALQAEGEFQYETIMAEIDDCLSRGKYKTVSLRLDVSDTQPRLFASAASEIPLKDQLKGFVETKRWIRAAALATLVTAAAATTLYLWTSQFVPAPDPQGCWRYETLEISKPHLRALRANELLIAANCEAVSKNNKATEIDKMRASVYAAQLKRRASELDEALRFARQAQSLNETLNANDANALLGTRLILASVHALRNESEQAFALLSTARQSVAKKEFDFANNVNAYPEFFGSLRADPRYDALKN